MTLESGNLDKLLNWDGDLTEFKDVLLERNGFNLDVKLKSMSSDMNNKLEEECTTIAKVRGEIKRDLDERKYLLLQLYNCVEDPDLSNDALQKKFNPHNQPYRIVEKIFKVGEQIKLVKIIQRMSGFASSIDDMDNEIENLLKRSE